MAGADVSFDSVVEYFESLPDPRHTRKRRHLLVDVIVISVCGVIVGCEGPTAIVRWAKAKEDWLSQLLELPNGIPSRDTVRPRRGRHDRRDGLSERDRQKDQTQWWRLRVGGERQSTEVA